MPIYHALSLSDEQTDRVWGTPETYQRLGGRSHHIGLEGEGTGASLEQCGPAIPLKSLTLWNLSIFSRWLGRRKIRNPGEGRAPYIVWGDGSCSDPLWEACDCTVPGVTSLKMPEPGKKPGSSGSGVGIGCGEEGLGHLRVGAGLRVSSREWWLAAFQVFFLVLSFSFPSF